MQGDVVPVEVGEREGAAERAIDRRGDYRATVGHERVVNGLDIRGVKPDGGADAGLRNRREVGAGHDIAKGECDRRRLEDDGVGRAGLRSHEAEILLIEGLARVEVAYLQGDEIWAVAGI